MQDLHGDGGDQESTEAVATIRDGQAHSFSVPEQHVTNQVSSAVRELTFSGAVTQEAKSTVSQTAVQSRRHAWESSLGGSAAAKGLLGRKKPAAASLDRAHGRANYDRQQQSSLCVCEADTPLPEACATPTSWETPAAAMPAHAAAQPPSLFDQLGQHPMRSLDAQRSSANFSRQEAVQPRWDEEGSLALPGSTDASVSQQAAEARRRGSNVLPSPDGGESPVCSSPASKSEPSSAASSPREHGGAFVEETHSTASVGQTSHAGERQAIAFSQGCRQNLLPPVLPHYKSSPLRTPGKPPRQGDNAYAANPLRRRSADAALQPSVKSSIEAHSLNRSLDLSGKQHASLQGAASVQQQQQLKAARSSAGVRRSGPDGAQPPLRWPASRIPVRPGGLHAGVLLETVPEQVNARLCV